MWSLLEKAWAPCSLLTDYESRHQHVKGKRNISVLLLNYPMSTLMRTFTISWQLMQAGVPWTYSGASNRMSSFLKYEWPSESPSNVARGIVNWAFSVKIMLEVWSPWQELAEPEYYSAPKLRWDGEIGIMYNFQTTGGDIDLIKEKPYRGSFVRPASYQLIADQ